MRDVLPSQPAHWLLLIGSTCLFISQRLAWWPTQLPEPRPFLWTPHAVLLGLPLLFAGAAGYRVALLPCQRPVRRLVMTVLLPSLASIIAIASVGLIWHPDELGLSKFLLRSAMTTPLDYWRAVPDLLMNLGLGSQFAATGILLVVIFMTLVGRGVSLPVRLGLHPSNALSQEEVRTRSFVWMMISLVPVALILGEGPIAVAVLVWKDILQHTDVATVVASFGSALPLFLLVLLALGKDRQETLRNIFRRLSPKYLLLAVLLPGLLALVWPAALFLRDRGVWAAHDFGRYGPPSVEDYFVLPTVGTLALFVPALVEEIAWRGYLQPRSIEKYGVGRGLFLVGIVWGAFHFFVDFRSYMAASVVLITTVRRLIEMVTQSYVLGWLTIRGKSILPAAIAHATFNICLLSQTRFFAPIWFLIGLWALLAYVLFRYSPPPALQESTVDLAAPPAPEPTAETG